jgi:hypothetical protein
VPLEQLGDEAGNLSKEHCVVLVCRSGKRARLAADKLMELGLEPKVLEEGMSGWVKAGFTARRGTERLSVERQTQLTIGLGILIGLALGLFVNPWFLVLPAIFGGGLTFAGLSGTCGLMVLLSRAPWNSNKACSSNRSCCGN